MNYYNEIKDTLVKNEIYKITKDYSKNKSDLNSYYEVGRLLVEAQGGEERAKYGNKLIQEYSQRLTKELGRGYTYTGLSRMRQFYLLMLKLAPAAQQLKNVTWSHYVELLPFKEIEKIKYYINITNQLCLSRNELRERIKSKEYERIGYKDELESPKVNTLIKEPVIIKTNTIPDKVSELFVHNSILEDMSNFLKQLGVGFAYIDDEVKIKIGNNYHHIDFLLYNVKFNCYAVLELKVVPFKAQHVGQIKKYMGYVDEHIKETFNNKTIGIICARENDKYVFKYINPDDVFVTTYELEKTKQT